MPNTYGRAVEEIRPTQAAVEAAQERKTVIPVWFRRDDPHIIERIVGVLNQKKPVIIGVRWPHWRTLRNNYLLKDQKPLENAAHAVTLVGYRNNGGVAEGTTFIFRNSYGYDWGNAGCGFIHASYLRDNLVGAFFLRVP
jgi:C1A family cysteine protease